jgi:mycofactocin glycosyltransferase
MGSSYQAHNSTPGRDGRLSCQDWAVNSPSREDGGAPAPIGAAPDRASTPLPPTFGLTVDPGTSVFDGGRVLLGGSPLRLLRVSARASVLIDRWQAGAAVGDRKGEPVLARRLVSAGVFLPRPGARVFGPEDVTTVIPVRDRPEQLRRLLSTLDATRCLVVDDGSSDPARTWAVAEEAGATVIALPTNVGPSAARNAGLAQAGTPLVAFLDSDCVPDEGWLDPLLAHFNDPLVVAVAPRIVPLGVTPPTTLSRYETVRSSLDRGSTPGLVQPLSRIPYVPSAALLLRRAAVPDALFDPALRGGEDVDLVWRLVQAGWDVRYEPDATVGHDGPSSAGAWLGRRAFYGTTAGPLARRHPRALAPLHTSAWTAAVWVLAAARRPLPAAGVLAASIFVLARRLEGLVDQPAKVATRIAGGGTARSALPALGGLTRAWSPALILALCWRKSRRAAALALLAPAASDWAAAPEALDPVRFAVLHVADDVAYGSGVWLGCFRARTIAPLLPRIELRTRIWSTRSLRAQLGDRKNKER